MVDFADVDFIDTIDETPIGPSVAPEGTYPCKVIESVKYQSKSGNNTLKITFQVDNGKYKDHVEYFSLWHPTEDVRRIATEKFTRLAKAVGFKKYPDDASAYVGKELLMNLRNVDEEWKDNDGNARTTTKTVVRSYEFKNDFSTAPESASDDAEVSPPPF